MVASPYQAFLAAKTDRFYPQGFDVSLSNISPEKFGDKHQFQPHIIQWALNLGCAAIFASYGFGKTVLELEWANHIARLTGGKVLILAPLAVAKQTIAEASKFGIDSVYCRSQTEADNNSSPIVVTNYEMLKEFHSNCWTGIVLDESGCLKNYSGITKRRLFKFAKTIKYRLCGSANPSPNDLLELLNQADFLGVKTTHSALSKWFINDTMNAGKYTLRPYAAKDFWQWVASWAVCLTMPSDLGFSDEGWTLPGHEQYYHCVDVDLLEAVEPDPDGQGNLFRIPKINATSVHQEQRLNVDRLAAKAAEIVDKIQSTEPNASIPIWCFTNYESDALQNAIECAVDLRGSESIKSKEYKLEAFSESVIKVLITKPDLAGLGLNWQFAHHQIFVMGTSFSFELYHQALHRLLRFGQQHKVHTHLVYPSTANRVQETIAFKEEQFHLMRKELRLAVKQSQLSIHPTNVSQYNPQTPMVIPQWLKSKAG